MRADRKCSSVKLECSFDLILFREENKVSVDENKLRIRLASNLMVGFCIERQNRIKSFFNIHNSLPKVLLVHLAMELN